MLRNHQWLNEMNGNHEDKDSKDKGSYLPEYEIVEEEVIETLSDNGDIYLGLEDAEVEYEIEEEIIEDSRPRLAGIFEEVEEEEEDEEEYDERSVYTEDMRYTQVGSPTEFEIADGDVEAIVEEILVEEEYVDDTIHGDETEIEEVTIREDDDDFALSSLLISEAIDHSSCTASKSSLYKHSESVPTDKEDFQENEVDGVSAEECREAIDYILRQERAVARMILTEDQAKKMTHLPVKVMKIIIDHMEQCDNNHSPIDWDFLLLVVMPFCDSDVVGDNDDSSDDEDCQPDCGCVKHTGVSA